MTVIYDKFDSTAATIVNDLVTKILAHADWNDITPGTPASTTNTVATGTSGGSVTWTVSSTADFRVGDTVVIQPGGANETYRSVVSINSGTSMTLTTPAMPVSYAIGTTIRVHAKVLKCTTPRGADMIVNFYGVPQLNGMQYDLFYDHSGVAGGGVDRIQRYLHWRSATTGMVSTDPVHCVLSVSEDHLFIETEGARPTETNPTSTIYGSVRTYMALSDLVPYHVADTTPAVVHTGNQANTPSGSTTNNSHSVDISRNWQDTISWVPGRLATLDFPTVRTSDTIALERSCAIDGKEYMWPYVVLSQADGIRGRLSRFFNCGTTAPTAVFDRPDAIGSEIEYDGIAYRLRPVNKGDGTINPWNAFGSSASQSNLYTPVVAIPYADV